MRPDFFVRATISVLVVSLVLFTLAGVPSMTFAAGTSTSASNPLAQLAATSSAGDSSSTASSSSTSAFAAPKAISGHVIQGTTGATLATDTKVTLTVQDSTGNTLKTMTQSLGPNDSFTFSDFPSKDGYQYQLGLLKNGQPEVMNLDATGGPNDVKITTYEATSSMADLSIPTQVLMIPKIDPKDRQIAVLELAEIVNSGDRSFNADLANPPVSGTMPTLLTFSLPKGYQDLQVESDMPDGGHTVEVGPGFALVNPVLPGQARVVYRYAFPYKGSSATFDHAMPLGASEFRVLYPAGQAKISVDGMSQASDAQIGTTTYKVLIANHVPPGQHLLIKISSLPQPSVSDVLSNFVTQSAWITVGAPTVVGMAMIALLGYTLLLRRRRRAALATGDEILPRDAIIESIAVLDEQHEAGQVSEEDYQAQRAALIEKLTANSGRKG